MNWMGTVYHGLPANVLKLRNEPGGYLAFLGRISPEKRPDLAIKIARRAGIPLKIAAKLDRTGVEYFEEVVRPLLDGPGVEFVGEINDSRKQEFLGNAIALVFPIDWPEPFGLVTIEAMACGTPVLARPCGSIPEILEHGVSGIIAETVDDLADAARRARDMSRRACRAAFDRRFTAAIMASNYEQLYLRLIESRAAASKRRPMQVSGNSRQESSESGDSTQV
jgi:glycosyltransferase involved in cell wall biosynthesis